MTSPGDFMIPLPSESSCPKWQSTAHMCHGQKSLFFGGGHPTFNRNPYNGYINPYYWVDDHPLLYGNNGSLDPGTYDFLKFIFLKAKKLPKTTTKKTGIAHRAHEFFFPSPPGKGMAIGIGPQEGHSISVTSEC